MPCDTVAETNDRPDGNKSLTCTPVAVLSPTALLSVMVKWTVAPWVGFGLSTDFCTVRSTGIKPALRVGSFWPDVKARQASCRWRRRCC